MIVTCPECEQKMRVNAEVSAGQRVKCPKCATLFRPADEDEEAPARPEAVTSAPLRPGRSARPAPEPEEEDERPRKSRTRPRDEEDEEEPRPRGRSRREEGEDEEAPPPRRRPRDGEEEEADRRPRRRKRARSGNAVVLWVGIGGAVAMVALLGVVVLVVLWSLGNSSAQQEKALQEEIQMVREFRQILEGVKDQNSARTAAAQLNALTDRMDAYGQRARKLTKIPQTEVNRLKAKYKPELDQLQQEIQKVAFQAGLNSRGEASFMSALMKFSESARRVEALSK